MLNALGLGWWDLGKSPPIFAERRGLGLVYGPSRPVRWPEGEEGKLPPPTWESVLENLT